MTTRDKGITLSRQQAVSIKALGATGDGITDDTTAIQAVFNAYLNVFVPEGIFIVSQITMRSGQTVYGSGAAGVLKQKAGTTQFNSVLYALAKSNITVKNVAIDGNGNNVAVGEHNHGVYLEDCTDCIVNENFLHDCNGDCVYIASSTNAVLNRRTQVMGNNIYNLGRHGICVAEYGARGIVVAGNIGQVGTQVSTSTSHGNPIHFELDSTPAVYVGDFVVAYNMCYDRGISLTGQINNIAITGNVIRGSSLSTDFGLILAINCSNMVISNNTIVGDNITITDGVYIQDAGYSGSNVVKNVVIKGNTIEKVSGHGISFIGSGTGIPSIGRINISHNMIDTVGTGQAKNGITVNSPCPEVEILFNAIKGTTNVGINLSGAQNFQIAGNRISEWAGTYGIYMSTSSAIGSGPGFVDKNIFTHTSAGSKVAVRIENEATNTLVNITNNMAIGFSTAVAIGGLATNISQSGNIIAAASLQGTFTLGAAVSTAVTNGNVTTSSRIKLTPTNAAAATLLGSAKALYVTKAAGSFTVSTASATAAAGTETFEYEIS